MIEIHFKQYPHMTGFKKTHFPLLLSQTIAMFLITGLVVLMNLANFVPSSCEIGGLSVSTVDVTTDFTPNCTPNLT